MAVVTSTLTGGAKNALLNKLNDIQLHGTGAAINSIAAVNTSNELIGATTFTFGTSTGGVIDKSGGDIIIEIPSGQTINGIRYYKISTNGEDDVIEPISITPTTFTYGGKILITQLKVTLT